MLFKCFITLIFLSTALATFIIPGCPSLFQFDYQSLSENDTLPPCYCDASTDYSTDLIQINCIFGSTLEDVTDAIKKVNDADKTVTTFVLERLLVDDQGIPDDYFQNLNVTPTDITLKYCRVPNMLSQNALRGLDKNMIKLEISECVLGFIPKGINQLINLESLNLAYNGITTIQKDDLSQLTNLKALDLTGNGLTNVEVGSFRDLKSLEDLSLGPDNNLNSSILNEISELTTLVYLNLMNNHIEIPQDGIFKKLSNLTGIHLETNVISAITPKTFEGLTSLQYLNLVENLIKTIEPNSFAELPNLKFLSLRTNYVGEIRPETFKSDSLSILNLVFNDFEQLKSGTFKFTKNLTELNLGANSRLISIDSGAFNELTNLQKLNLSYANLSSLNAAILKSVPNLLELDVSNTQIKKMDKHVFDSVKNLTVLRIADTELQALPQGIFDKLDNLKVLDLYGNKWVCDKNIAWLVKYLKSKSADIQTNAIPQCDSPKELSGQSLFEVDTDTLD